MSLRAAMPMSHAILHCLQILILYFTTIQGWDLHTLPSQEQLSNRRAGENLMVVCSIDSVSFDARTQTSIEWFHESSTDKPIARMGRVMTMTKGKALSKQLMFVKPAVDDSGVYTCIAKAIDGDVQRKSLNISFIRAAEFVEVERDQHPEEGKDALISCRVSGDRSLEIFWQFNGNTIAQGGPRGYELRENNQVLFVPNFVSEQDDGMYLCNAAQFSSFETLPINVTAYARPQMTVFEGPEKGHGFEGHNAQIQCQAVGKPKPQYKWTRKTEGSDSEESLKASDKYTVKGGLLVIHSVIPSDQGVYSCIAYNALDQQQSNINLSVFKKPRIEKMSNATRERGDSVELRCSYSGDGEIKTKWIHQGEQWSYDGGDTNNGQDTSAVVQDSRIRVDQEDKALILRIHTLGEDDAGQYQCVVENEAGVDQRSTFLFITHEPSMTGHSDTQRALAGSKVHLSCEVSAVPDPSWTWSGSQGVLEADGTKITIHSEGTSSNLTILDAEESDYGTYVCTADNGIGSAVRAQIEVVQIFIPDVPSDVTCHEHIYPTFATCKVYGYNNVDIGHRPTELIFYYAKDTEVDGGMDWESQTKNVTLRFSPGSDMKLTDLEPNSRYTVVIQAINEAGVSDVSQPDFIETTDPWAPETPQVISSECSTVCSISWQAPNDHGSPLTSYRLFVREQLNDVSGELADEVTELDLQADETNVDLMMLKPLRSYEVRLVAVNEIGHSSPYTLMLKTSEYSGGSERALKAGSIRIVLAVCFVLVFVMLVIDMICFATNRCGLLACLCINCLGRNIHTNKAKEVERNNKSTESNRLLNDGNAEVRITVTDEKNGVPGTGPQSTSV